jgi:hypothetical protein
MSLRKQESQVTEHDTGKTTDRQKHVEAITGPSTAASGKKARVYLDQTRREENVEVEERS